MKFKVFLVILEIFLYLCTSGLGQSGCQTSYSNMAIMGNDLKSVSGSSSSCCQACQQTSGCSAYTWNSYNGGTCWLKNFTQPIYTAQGQFTVMMSPTLARTYNLNISYDATNFFDGFLFKTENYGNGFTNFTDMDTAMKTGIAQIQNGKVYLGSDNTTIIPWDNTQGRSTIRLESVIRWNSGLFIFNIDHMPTGPGLWPAFWTTSHKWPQEGEIDILESISAFNYNQITLHTDEGCAMQLNDSQFFTGTWGLDNNKPGTNCWGHAPGQITNAGCSVEAQNGTFNTGFNKAGGGVFAMEWDREHFIRVWNFVRPNIPADINNNSPNPNPDTWGMPTAYFPLGANCNASHFQNHIITINNAFCGWAGEQWFYTGGPCKCENSVRFSPWDFSEAYFLVNYVKVFCRPGDPCRSKEING